MAKVFEHFLEFPDEVRMIVINEMSPEDRCRFRQCSKLSQIEAQKCKNYIYGMRFYVRSNTDIVLHILYTKQYKKQNFGDYSIRFYRGGDGGKYMIYSTQSGGELWRTKVENSNRLGHYAENYLKNMLQKYQNTIKILDIKGAKHDLGIGSLNNLESLKLDNQTDIRPYISKLQKPLKELHCNSAISVKILKDYEQIYEVQDVFNVNEIHMKYAQFQKLSARKMYLEIGKLNEEDIANFIQSWQNDKLRNNFQYCRWNIKYSFFNVQKLFRLLRIRENVEEKQRLTKIDIVHNKDVMKKAEIGLDCDKIEFRVINQ